MDALKSKRHKFKAKANLILFDFETAKGWFVMLDCIQYCILLKYIWGVVYNSRLESKSN